MNAKPAYQTPARSSRSRFNAIRNLRPESLSRALEAFENGRLSEAARMFENIVRRDDLISGLYMKRRKCVARLTSEVVEKDSSERAKEHAEALRAFYDSIEVQNFCDQNERGGFRALVMQMMSAVGFRYSAHRMEFVRRS